MKKEVDIKKAVALENEIRSMIGQGIIDGLLKPGSYGALGELGGTIQDWGSNGDYQQTGGGDYDQGCGGHDQSGGGGYDQTCDDE